MDKEAFLVNLRDSIRAITNRRLFSTERGYQGQLITELKNRVNIKQIFSKHAILEQEYQKTLEAHGINIRPDLIIHIPYETGIHNDRRSGNYVVIQLKLNASEEMAQEDFNKLDLMFGEELDYPLGIFLNINSGKTFFDCYTGDYRERLHCFAVRLVDDEVIIYEQ